ncbi:unnamed protein product [Soboliphyme baturini]|uniref:Zinc finger, C2H2 type n=1 Tax=Soboliphyme baturini TaxID=241478 RepID=A0A183IMR5_9BILA|nr:unnamed protein product [Soboliphyme baturini]
METGIALVRYEDACKCLKQTVELYQSVGDTNQVGRSTLCMVLIRLMQGDPVEAAKLCQHNVVVSSSDSVYVPVVRALVSASEDQNFERMKEVLTCQTVRMLDSEILQRLVECFRELPVEQLSAAIDLVRGNLESMRAILKEKVSNDAFDSVTLMAEGMIKEAYYDFLECGSPTNSAVSPKTPMLSPLYPPSLSLHSEDCDLSLDVSAFSSAAGVEERTENMVLDLLEQRLTSQSQPCDREETSVLMSLMDADSLPHDSPSSNFTKNFQALPPDVGQPTAVSAPTPSHNAVYVCEICGFTSRHRQSLYRHRKLHSGEGDERRFSCAFCAKRFKTSSALHEHHSYVHTKVRKFVCPLCSQAFIERKDVNRHVKVHSCRMR